MGQFLGFSRVHSSTVALVRNLHTGHVSPQYHIVVDDKFETVFNEGRPKKKRLTKFTRLSSREIVGATLRRSTIKMECLFMSPLLWMKCGSMSPRRAIV